jgi:hypothetical protein
MACAVVIFFVVGIVNSDGSAPPVSMRGSILPGMVLLHWVYARLDERRYHATFAG